jgi:hypothetical protein
MPSKRCPICKLVNPATAQTCDCGYSFETRMPGEPTEVTPKQSLHQVAKVTIIVALAFALTGVVLAAAATSSFYQQVGIGLLLVGALCGGVARALWRASRFTRDS